MMPRIRAIGSAGERLVHTEEVTGSIPVSPTTKQQVSEMELTPQESIQRRHDGTRGISSIQVWWPWRSGPGR
jgi:hypothetical protein